MDQRSSRSYGDSRSGRRPDYDSEGVQGRFGRQEDWREAERKQAARKLTLREQVELEAAEMERERREAAERRAAEQRRRRQMAQQQAAEERMRRQQEEERRRNRPLEPETNVQGRFGRQSPRPNPERLERARATQQARQQYDYQRSKHSTRAQASAYEHERAQRPLRQMPTQADAQRQAQQRVQRQAAQEQPQQHMRQQRSVQREQAVQEHDEWQPRTQPQAGRVQEPQEAPDAQVVPAAHGGRHMPRVQQTEETQHASAYAQARQAQQAHEAQWGVDQGLGQHSKDQLDPFEPQVSQEAESQAQPWAQQQGRQSAYRPSFGDPEATSRYARESYGSSRKKGSFTVNPAGHSGKSMFDRRPNVDRTPSSHRSSSSKLPNISPKIIAIIAAIFVIVILVSLFNSCGQQGDADAGQTQGTTASAAKQASLPTPIMSESSGITMHSAVAMEDLTEVLIHNASYAYANEITTQLKEAKNTDIIAAHGTGRVASEQPTGDKWMTGEFIRCFREGNAGPVMSAIDCGGPVGATVYAPVTGEVILVKQYKLYNEIDDYRIHIRPEGRPDLDVVLIHLTDVTVKAGDKVTAGVTPMAKIRDVFQYLGDSMQLKNYTAEGDNGNHTHIQVNNANHPEYTALDELKPQPVTPSEPNAQATSGASTPTTDA